MVEHQSCEYRFVIGEDDTGVVFISLQNCGEEPQRLKGWDMVFDLPDGTTYERAKEIALFLNDNLVRLSLNGPVEPLHEESSTRH